MTVGLLEDTGDSEEMLNGKIEEHQLHRLVCLRVVLLECVVSTGLEPLSVIQLFVLPLHHSEGSENVTEKKTTEFIKSVNLVVSVVIQVLK